MAAVICVQQTRVTIDRTAKWLQPCDLTTCRRLCPTGSNGLAQCCISIMDGISREMPVQFISTRLEAVLIGVFLASHWSARSTGLSSPGSASEGRPVRRGGREMDRRGGQYGKCILERDTLPVYACVRHHLCNATCSRGSIELRSWRTTKKCLIAWQDHVHVCCDSSAPTPCLA